MNLRNDIKLFSILLLSFSPLIFVSFGTFLPLTNGFYYVWAKALFSGELYQSIYCPFPPLTVIIEGMPTYLFNGDLLFEQIQHLSVWLILVLLIVKIYSQMFIFKQSTQLTFIVVFSYLYYSEPHDIISSYYETALLLVAGTLFLLQRTVIEKHGSYLRLQFLSLSLSSLFWFKQSFILLSLSILLAYCYYLIIYENRNQAAKLLLSFLVLNTSLIILFTRVFSFKALRMLLGEAKQPSLDRIWTNVVLGTTQSLGYVGLILIFISCIMLSHSKFCSYGRLLCFASFSEIIIRSFIYNGLVSSQIRFNIYFEIGLSLLLFILFWTLWAQRNAQLVNSGNPTPFVKLMKGLRGAAASSIAIIGIVYFLELNFTFVVELDFAFMQIFFKLIKLSLWPCIFLFQITFLLLSAKTIFTCRKRNLRDLEFRYLQYFFFFLIANLIVLVNALSGGIRIQSFLFTGPLFLFLLFAKEENRMFELRI